MLDLLVGREVEAQLRVCVRAWVGGWVGVDGWVGGWVGASMRASVRPCMRDVGWVRVYRKVKLRQSGYGSQGGRPHLQVDAALADEGRVELLPQVGRQDADLQRGSSDRKVATSTAHFFFHKKIIQGPPSVPPSSLSTASFGTWPEAAPTPSRALRRPLKLRGDLEFLLARFLPKSESMSSITTIVSLGRCCASARNEPSGNRSREGDGRKETEKEKEQTRKDKVGSWGSAEKENRREEGTSIALRRITSVISGSIWR